MIKPIIPINDEERIRELYSYGIFNNEMDPGLMELTELAKSIMNIPIAYISFMDKDHEIFLTASGIREKIADRSTSFCGHAINDPENVMVVKDARMDLRFFDNPMVIRYPHIVFYAAAPLVSHDGHALGTLSVIDFKSNDFSENQIRDLRSLAAQVVNILEKNKGEIQHLKRAD